MSHIDNDPTDDGSTKRRRFLKAIGALGVVGLAGCGGDGDSTESPTDTDTPTDTATPTDTDTPTGPATPNVTPTDTDTPTDTATPTDTDTPTDTATQTPSQPIPSPPAKLLSFESDSRLASAGQTITLNGTITNPYLFDVSAVQVSLAGPTGDWGISPTGSTSFETIASQSTKSVGWEVTVPDGVEGDQTLTATVEYASTTDSASVEVTTGVSVIPPAPDVTSPITDGLVGQIDAAQLSATDSLSLWQIVNPDGRTATLTQTNSNAQPSVVSGATTTGELVTRFKGESDFMTTNAPLTTATSGVTISAAFRIDNKDKLRQVIAFNGSDEAGNGYGLILNSEADGNEVDGSVDILYGGVNWWYSDATIQDDAFHVATLVIPSDAPENPSLFLDGTEASFRLQGSAAPPGTPSNQFGIGQDEVVVDQPPYLDGDVGEELVFDRALSESERGDIETYLSDKWIGN